jgi:hypothetical protein
MGDGLLACQTKLFTVGKEMILCNTEHTDFAVHSTTIIKW